MKAFMIIIKKLNLRVKISGKDIPQKLKQISKRFSNLTITLSEKHFTKNKFSKASFSLKCLQNLLSKNPQIRPDLCIFTEEILNGEL